MKQFTIIYSFIILLSLNSCSETVDYIKLQTGSYEMIFSLDSVDCPIRITVSDEDSLCIKIINDSETIEAINIKEEKDSIFFDLPIFNSTFRLKKQTSTSFNGEWVNNHKTENNIIKVSAQIDTQSYTTNTLKTTRWLAKFSANTPDYYPAIATLHYNNTHITGTFQTETGDYRFLEGKITGKHFYMSCFDGSHLFYFTGAFTNDSTISNGKFYSGKTWSEPWEATINDTTQLNDPYQITYLKNKEIPFEFAFPDTLHRMVSLNDSTYNNKIVLVQIMGTWCPNCLDETKYYIDLYRKYNSKGLEIISLAFEARDNFEYAKNRITALTNQLKVPYPILIAGVSNKEKASAKMPMLNSISSFPTSILIDKNKTVVSIYTGFNGPSTGKDYEEYKTTTENQIEQLLK